jgi:DNA-binding IscR family transcriptional regulator
MTVVEVIEAVDGPIDMTKSCILGLDECHDGAPCALHEYWKLFRDQYTNTVSTMTLEAAAASLDQKRKNRQVV